MQHHQRNKSSSQSRNNSSFVGGEYHAQSQRVLKHSDIDKAQNIKRAYDPKVLEFLQFCTSLYGNTPSPRIVDEKNFFAFLFYQAYIERKLKKE